MPQFAKSLHHNLSRVTRDRYSRNIGCIGEPFLPIQGKPAYGQNRQRIQVAILWHTYVPYMSCMVPFSFIPTLLWTTNQVAIGET